MITYLEMNVTPEEFTTWRKTHGLTQERAAYQFKVTRTTIQNWESGATSLPSGVEDLCKIWGRRFRQVNPGVGPLTLIYSDAPMFVNAFGPRSRPAMMHQEAFATNAAAIARLMFLSAHEGFHNAFIMEESGEMLWNAVEISAIIRGDDHGAPTISNLLHALADQIRQTSIFAVRGPNSLTPAEIIPRKSEIDAEVEKLVAMSRSDAVNDIRYTEVDAVLLKVRKLGLRPSDQLVSGIAQAIVSRYNYES